MLGGPRFLSARSERGSRSKQPTPGLQRAPSIIRSRSLLTNNRGDYSPLARAEKSSVKTTRSAFKVQGGRSPSRGHGGVLKTPEPSYHAPAAVPLGRESHHDMWPAGISETGMLGGSRETEFDGSELLQVRPFGSSALSLC